jgi:hypothetical protein
MQVKSNFTLFRFLFSFFLLVQANSINAQTFQSGSIKGVIVDEKNIPLPFVTVILKNSIDSSFYKSTLTDSKGVFNIEMIKEGKYVLNISMLGFNTYLKSGIIIGSAAYTIDFGRLKMTPAVKMLNGVSVVAQKPLIERRPDKIIVNLNSTIGSGSMMDVLSRLPGVQVNPDDQINLNGRTVAIYIDGRPTPLSSDALSSLLKGMSPASIQKIELIAHPSSKYDAAGSGGIINIVRKKNSKDGLSGNVYGGAGYGKYGKANGGVNLNYKSDGYNLFFNMDYAYTKYFVNNNIKTDFYDNNFLFTGETAAQTTSVRNSNNYTPNFGIDLYLSKKTTLSISATDGIQLFDKNANTNTEDFNIELNKIGDNTFSNLVHTKSVNFSSNMHLLHQIDSLGNEYTVDLDYYRYSNISGQNNLTTIYDSTGALNNNFHWLFDQDRKFSVYSAKADYTLPLKNNANFETGWKSSYVESNNSNETYNIFGDVPIIDPAQNDFFNYSENINALYANYSKNDKKLSYQIGARAESTWGRGNQIQTGEIVHINYVKLFPSAFLDYKFDENHGLNLSLNKKIDRPTYENLDPLVRVINSNTYLQGNPNLLPVISYNSSLTYSYKNALFATFNYGINLHDFTYLTAPIDSSGITITKPTNNKYSQYFSFILAYNKQLKPWWFTSTNITLRQQTFTSDINTNGLNTSGILAFNFDTYNSFNLTKKLSFLVLYQYRGKSVVQNITNDPYFLVVSGLRQQIFGNRGILAVNVTDIFHSFKSKFVQNSVNVKQYWNNEYETRLIRVNFSYSFGGKIKKPKTGTGADEEKKRTNIKEN